jgi:hypothetical protein
MWLQDPDSLSSGNSHLLMIFVAMVAVALSVQAIALIAIAVGAAKAQNRMVELAEQLHAKMVPLIDSSHEMVRDTSPKIKVITDNLVETSHIVRSKAVEFDATLTDVNQRTKAHVQRVDGMVDDTLKATADIGATLRHIVRVPVMEVAGLVNGMKAALDVMVGKTKRGFGRSTPPPPVSDRDVY